MSEKSESTARAAPYTLPAILKEIGLGDYTPVQIINANSDAGEERSVVLACTNQKGPRLLLKEHRGYLSEAEFHLHIDLHRHLISRQAPVVLLVETADRPLPLKAAGRLFELHIWADGVQPDPSSVTDMELMANTLAKFHVAARDFPWPRDPAIHGEPRQRIQKAESYRDLLDKALGSSSDPLAISLYAWLERAQLELKAIYHEFGAELEQPIHGDPDTPNGLITADGCLLLDFDDAHLGTITSDLGWMIALSAGIRYENQPVPYTFRSQWSTSLIRAITKGYTSVAGLNVSNRKALPWWIISSIVCAVVDCLFLDEPLVSESRLRAECANAIRLISEVEQIEF